VGSRSEMLDETTQGIEPLPSQPSKDERVGKPGHYADVDKQVKVSGRGQMCHFLIPYDGGLVAFLLPPMLSAYRRLL
jgi:hypothetical protein